MSQDRYRRQPHQASGYQDQQPRRPGRLETELHTSRIISQVSQFENDAAMIDESADDQINSSPVVPQQADSCSSRAQVNSSSTRLTSMCYNPWTSNKISYPTSTFEQVPYEPSTSRQSRDAQSKQRMARSRQTEGNGEEFQEEITYQPNFMGKQERQELLKERARD